MERMFINGYRQTEDHWRLFRGLHRASHVAVAGCSHLGRIPVRSRLLNRLLRSDIPRHRPLAVLDGPRDLVSNFARTEGQ